MCLDENLKQNLLSISQLRDKGYKVILIKQNMSLRIHVMTKFCLLEINVLMYTPLI